MRTERTFRPRQAGLTLIELMVAVVITSLLLLGAMGLFVSNKRIYREQDSMGRLQENALFALNLLVNDVRMAGYIGGSDDAANITAGDNVNVPGIGVQTNLFDLVRTDGAGDPVAVAIEGLSEADGLWYPSGADPANPTDSPLATAAPFAEVALEPNSDGITVRYLAPIPNQAIVNLNTAVGSCDTVPIGSIPVRCISGNCDTVLFQGEPLAISDYSRTEIFAPTNSPAGASTTNLTPGVNLADVYGDSTDPCDDPNPQLSRFVAARYFIGMNTDVDGDGTADAQATPSLYRFAYDAASGEFQWQEIIQGVDTMQILYGVDTDDADPSDNINPDNIADSYVTAEEVGGNVGEWDRVVSVRIGLLLRTVNEDRQGGDRDGTTYTVLDEDVGPFNDFRRRRIYTATVQIRNRAN